MRTDELPLQDDPLEPIIESFLGRHRQGEQPSAESYAKEHPHLADRIRKLFPTLILMEELAASPDNEAEIDEHLKEILPNQSRIAEYRIVREIGRGGMGIVYLAEQESLRRHVALKVLTVRGNVSPDALERFQQESRSAARLHHPHIVPVFDVGEEKGTYYYAMQLINGRGLDEFASDVNLQLGSQTKALANSTVKNDVTTPLLNERDANILSSGTNKLQSCAANLTNPKQDIATSPDGWLTPRDRFRSIARIGWQVAEALAHAHEQGVLHRDIKPSNLLLDHTGNIWVTDFGLAKSLDTSDAADARGLTHTGDVIGTIRYMAPERFRGWSDPRSDIYSLGITLYELLTLKSPFNARDRLALMEQVSRHRPVHPRAIDRQIPRDLETIVLKAIDKEPSCRYASAAHFAEDLKRYLDDRPIRARRATAREMILQWVRRNPAIAAMAAVLFIVLATAWAVTFHLWRQTDVARIQAQSNLTASEHNLQIAIQAVDQFCAKVGNDPRLKEHDLRPLRKDLLQSAVGFQQQLLELRGKTKLARLDLARSYHRLAKLTAEIDALDTAIELNRRALSEYDELALHASDDTTYPLEVSSCLADMAQALTLHGDTAEAEHVLNRSIDILQGCLNGRTDWRDARESLAINLGLRAHLLEITQRLDASEAVWRKSIAEWDKLRAEESGNVTYLSNAAKSRWKLADVYISQGLGHWREAETELNEALIIQRIATSHVDATSTELQILGVILRAIGEINKISGRTEKAKEYLTEAITTFNRLREQEPSVPSHSVDAASSYNEVARCDRLQNRRDDALLAFRKAAELYDRAIKQAPGNNVWESRLAEALIALGRGAVERGQPQAALIDFDRSIAILDGILKRDATTLNVRKIMPFALNDRGKLLVSLGRSAEGISDLDRAVAMAYDDIRDSLRVDRSWCLAVCGDYGQASADVRAALKDLEINCPSTFLAKPFFVGALTYARSVRLVLEDESLVQTERERLANEYTNEAVLLLTRCLAMGHKTKEELLLDPELEPIRASIPDSIIEPQDRRSESSPPPDKLEPVHAEP